jgi:hypothetical protein
VTARSSSTWRGCPDLLAFERPVPGAKLAVAEARLLGSGVEQPECLVRGAEQCGLLDETRRGRRAKGGGVVDVIRELAVGGGPASPVLPVLAGEGVLGDGAESLECPLRGVVGELGADFVAAGVGGVCPVLEELWVLGVGHLAGDDVGGAVDVRGELPVQGRW